MSLILPSLLQRYSLVCPLNLELKLLLNLMAVFLLLPLISFTFPAEAVDGAEAMTCVFLFQV